MGERADQRQTVRRVDVLLQDAPFPGVFRQAGMEVRVSPVTTEEYGESKALRPKNSRLSKGKLTQMGFRPLPHWQDALKRYLKELEE